MLEIVICDDTNSFLDKLEIKLNNYFECLQNSSYRITRYTSIESLLQSDISQIDIIFLDVKFKSMNGIDAAVILRQLSLNFILIYISTFVEYAPEGYRVNAFRYILKEQIDLLFEEAMDEAIYKLGITRNTIVFKFIGSDKETTVYTDNIIFIESRLHEVHFHFINANKTEYLYCTLNSIQKTLPKDEFIRIHQSYIVNFKYFIDAKNYKAMLLGDLELPISQKLFSQVKKELYLYRGKI